MRHFSFRHDPGHRRVDFRPTRGVQWRSPSVLQEGIAMRPMSAASTLVMVLALGGSAVGQQNAVILLTPTEITWETRADGGKISVIEGNLREAGPFTMRVIVPAGWSHPPLFHPVAEHLTVLSRTI